MFGLTLCRPVLGADPVLQGEKKLERKVSLNTRRIHLGALLDRVGEECGVKLEADDRLEPISGYELTVRAEGQPARELLEAVSRLYSFPPDRWYWTRQRDGKLLLRPTLSNAKLAAERARFIEEGLLGELDQRRRFYALPPHERARLSAQDPYLKAIDNPRTEGFTSFLSGLGEADLRGIIRGGSLNIPFAQLPAPQQEFVRQEFALANEPFAPPENLRVYSRMRAGTSVVLLQNGSLGAHGVLGGATAAQGLDRTMQKGWVGNEESTTAPPGQLAGSGAETAIQDSGLDTLVSRIGASGKLNVLLDRGSLQKFSTDQTLSGRLDQILAHLSERRIVKWKRWRSFLLFRPTDWLALDRNETVPWPLIQRLQESTVENDGYLQERDWLRLALLAQAQLHHLSRGEFPDAAAVAQSQPLLLLVQKMTPEERRAAARPTGGSWLDWTGATKQRLSAILAGPDAQRARIHAAWIRRPAGPVASLFLGTGEVRPVEVPLKRARKWSDPQGRFVDLRSGADDPSEGPSKAGPT